MKPEDNIFTDAQIMDMIAAFKLRPDEELLSVYFDKENYSQEFIDLIRDELYIRGYKDEMLTSWEVAQTHFMERKSDLDLYEIYVNKNENLRTRNLAKELLDKRKVSLKDIQESYLLEIGENPHENSDFSKVSMKSFFQTLSKMKLWFWILLVFGFAWLVIAAAGSDKLRYTLTMRALSLFGDRGIDISNPTSGYGERSRIFCVIIGAVALFYARRLFIKAKRTQ
jgi:hypothetical protein